MKKLAALSIFGLLLTGCSNTPTSTPVYTPPAVESTQAAEVPTTPAVEVPADTPSQRNALRSAERYLDAMPFSRKGLIKQLMFEKYTAEDAAWAVDRVKVDWNVQASLSAKRYLDTMPFSREGLIKQLVFEGFTPEEAAYGVSTTGL